jgi:hypothetical protein
MPARQSSQMFQYVQYSRPSMGPPKVQVQVQEVYGPEFHRVNDQLAALTWFRNLDQIHHHCDDKEHHDKFRTANSMTNDKPLW